MRNGDRIRTFSDAQLALILMCPVDACLTFDDEEITIRKDSGACEKTTSYECAECIYKALHITDTTKRILKQVTTAGLLQMVHFLMCLGVGTKAGL